MKEVKDLKTMPKKLLIDELAQKSIKGGCCVYVPGAITLVGERKGGN